MSTSMSGPFALELLSGMLATSSESSASSLPRVIGSEDLSDIVSAMDAVEVWANGEVDFFALCEAARTDPGVLDGLQVNAFEIMVVGWYPQLECTGVVEVTLVLPEPSTWLLPAGDFHALATRLCEWRRSGACMPVSARIFDVPREEIDSRDPLVDHP